EGIRIFRVKGGRAPVSPGRQLAVGGKLEVSGPSLEQDGVAKDCAAGARLADNGVTTSVLSSVGPGAVTADYDVSLPVDGNRRIEKCELRIADEALFDNAVRGHAHPKPVNRTTARSLIYRIQHRPDLAVYHHHRRLMSRIAHIDRRFLRVRLWRRGRNAIIG